MYSVQFVLWDFARAGLLVPASTQNPSCSTVSADIFDTARMTCYRCRRHANLAKTPMHSYVSKVKFRTPKFNFAYKILNLVHK